MRTDGTALGAQQLLPKLAVVHPQIRRLDELQRKALHSDTTYSTRMHDMISLVLLSSLFVQTFPNEATASKHHMGGYFGDLRTV